MPMQTFLSWTFCLVLHGTPTTLLIQLLQVVNVSLRPTVRTRELHIWIYFSVWFHSTGSVVLMGRKTISIKEKGTQVQNHESGRICKPCETAVQSYKYIPCRQVLPYVRKYNHHAKKKAAFLSDTKERVEAIHTWSLLTFLSFKKKKSVCTQQPRPRIEAAQPRTSGHITFLTIWAGGCRVLGGTCNYC